jgi:hypothetical protein
LDGTSVSAVSASGTRTSIAIFAVVGPPATIGLGLAVNVPFLTFSHSRLWKRGEYRTPREWEFHKIKSAIAIVLLGMALCLPALGQNDETIADIHTDCQSKNEAKRAYAMGFIFGVAFVVNYISKGSLEKEALWPRTKGGIVDAVFKYIDLHPALWAEEATIGVVTVVNDLYLPSRQGKKK